MNRIRVIDHKGVDMTDEEYEYYSDLVSEFTFGTYNGKDQFHDMFEVDGEGCISMVKPPLKKEVGWAVIVFLQNLMINQRLRRMERKLGEFLNDKSNS
jgi:hypothetical protein